LRKVLATKWKELADKYCDNKGVNILMTHLYMMKKGGEEFVEPEDEKPILHIGGAQVIYSENIPKQIQYVALGHLHRKIIVDTKPCPIIYSSSPLAYSFSEANQQKYLMLIQVEPGIDVLFNAIPLTKGKKLLRECFDNIDEAVKWLSNNQNALVELTIISETFLTGEERKRLGNAHEGIINIIPVVKNVNEPNENHFNNIDITKNIEELFVDYFKYKHSQEPNERLINLFKEILSTEEQ